MKKLISLLLLMAMITITACDDLELNSKPLRPLPSDTTESESEPSDNISQEEAIALADKS